MSTKSDSDLKALFQRAEAGLPETLDRLGAFLRFASISTDPAHREDMWRCAEWLVAQFQDLGMTATVRPTAGQPVVVAHDSSAPADAPHLLYYGHYDVQPVSPLSEWQTPPFQPSVVEGKRGPQVVARGAVDDKGQMLTWMEALRHWKEVHGRLPVRVSVLVEGEEEVSSPSLVPFLKANRAELAADLCVISDTLMLAPDRPALTISMRGLVYVELTVRGPSRDLHSGTFGGTVVNPIHALSAMLTQLHDENGRVQIPGFYDDIEPVPDDVLNHFDALGFDEAAFYRSAGVPHGRGEAGRRLVERMWTRPCCDVNGIWGGYIEEGRKTVIPSSASAKLCCRLVPGQSDVKILAGIRRFFADRAAPDLAVEITPLGSSPAVRVPHDTAYVTAARRALATAFGRAPGLRGGAGSLPLIGDLKVELGVDCLLMGFGLDDDCVHGPNEKFELTCLQAGIRGHLAFLHELALGPTEKADRARPAP